MRTRALTLALTLLALVLAPVAHGDGEDDEVITKSCEPPRRLGVVIAEPCAVSEHVDTRLEARVYASSMNAGNLIVEARGPDGARAVTTCPKAPGTFFCVSQVEVGDFYVGEWTVTVKPAMTGVGTPWQYTPPHVRLEVDFW